MQKGHRILKLIPKPKGAPRLVITAASPHSCGSKPDREASRWPKYLSTDRASLFARQPGIVPNRVLPPREPFSRREGPQTAELGYGHHPHRVLRPKQKPIRVLLRRQIKNRLHRGATVKPCTDFARQVLPAHCCGEESFDRFFPTNSLRSQVTVRMISLTLKNATRPPNSA